MSIYVTGDCHSDFSKFSTHNFPEQKDLTHDDFVIVCGDFGGVWYDSHEERYWLDWLSDKSFTTLFVDGNHENFDRLLGNEFEVVDFHGGKAHKIRDNIYHLIRGEIFDICNKKIFAFGGASSHDIKDGILNPEDFKTTRALKKTYNDLTSQGKMLRINHLSWWREEMPSEAEMKYGLENLKKHGNKVDYIVSHCCPQSIASIFSCGFYKPDNLTKYFNEVSKTVEFSDWFFGHYHDNQTILGKYHLLYEQIIQVC